MALGDINSEETFRKYFEDKGYTVSIVDHPDNYDFINIIIVKDDKICYASVSKGLLFAYSGYTWRTIATRAEQEVLT